MITRIYFVRHGEVHNPKQIVYARLPGFKLSEKGQSEIIQTASFLKNKKIDFIYSSPILRAKQTAEIINKKVLHSRIRITKDLNEVKTSLQGGPLKSLKLDYYSPPLWKNGDETPDNISDRMMRFVKKAAAKFNGKSLIAVSHGDPIMVLKSSINNVPLKIPDIHKGRYLKNGEVLLLKINGDDKLTIKSVFVPK